LSALSRATSGKCGSSQAAGIKDQAIDSIIADRGRVARIVAIRSKFAGGQVVGHQARVNRANPESFVGWAKTGDV